MKESDSLSNHQYDSSDDNKFNTMVENTAAQNIYAETLGGNVHVADSTAQHTIAALAVTSAGEPSGSGQNTHERDAPQLLSAGLRFTNSTALVYTEIIKSDATKIVAKTVIETPFVALKKIDDMSLKTESVAEQEFNFGLIPILSPCVERQSIMDKITEALKIANIVVLTGMRGAGKSFLAKLYANKASQTKAYSSVYCISANSRGECETQFQGLLSKTLRMPLVLFDGAFDYAAIQACLAKIPASAKVIITSAYTEWPQEYSVITVPVFTSDESRIFFEKNNIKIDAGIEFMISEYCNHPLALAQACAFMLKNKITSERYQQLYQKSPALMLSGGNSKTLPLGYKGESVFSLWERELQKCDGGKNVSLLEKYSIDISPGLLIQKILSIKKAQQDSFVLTHEKTV